MFFHSMCLRVSALVLSVFFATVTYAAPTVSDMVPRGLRAGGTTLVTLKGTQLDQPGAKLLSPLVLSQKIVKATPTALQLEVLVASDALPGLHRFRVANGAGVSNAWIAGVDSLVQTAFTPTVDQVPIALSGTLNGAAILETKVELSEGDHFVAEVECRRLGGGARPVLRLLDPNGVQLTWGPFRSTPFGDARLVASIPTTGVYTVQLHDLLYKAAASPFRLKLGDFRFASMPYPLGVSDVGGASAFVDSNISSPVVVWRAPYFPSNRALARPVDLTHFSGPLPQVVLSGHLEWSEGQAGAISTPPVGLNGRLEAPNQRDVFRVPVTPGQTLRCEVLAHQAGSPVDAVLDVKAVGGGALGNNDDSNGRTDPVVQFKVPDKITEIEIGIRDITRRGAENFVYRIGVTPVGTPSFQLKVTQDVWEVPANGRQLLQLNIQRQGYNGPIRLEAASVDGGQSRVEIENKIVPAGATQAILAVRSSASGAGLFMLRGSAVNANVSASAIAVLDSTASQDGYVVGASDDLAIATMSPVPHSFGEFPVVATPYLGQSIAIPVQIDRGGKQGPIRFRLVSSQKMPRKKIKENNQDKEVDDIDRALRVEGENAWGADQSTGNLTVVVPTDLPLNAWQLSLAAELLSDDGKAVIATAYSPVHTVTPAAPFRIELKSSPEVQGIAGEGQAGELVGIVHRTAGFELPVKVSLQGLGEGYAPPMVELPANVTEFRLPIRFDAKAKPAKLDKAQLIATWTPNPMKPQQTFKSNAVAVKIDVQAGTPEPTDATPEGSPADEKAKDSDESNPTPKQ